MISEKVKKNYNSNSSVSFCNTPFSITIGVEVVVLHQYCHLKYKTHCKAFYDLLKKYEPDYKYYDELLNRLEK